jgi:hypothetical protein
MHKTLLISFLVLALTSCFEEDVLVSPHMQGDLEVGIAALGPEYAYQVYYDLNKNMEVASNLVSAWDLSFESNTGGWIIRLNSSKFMYAGNSMDTAFTSTLSQAELEMVFDASHGHADSTALGPWYDSYGEITRSHGYVYLIDRGTDHQFKPVGLKKVKFEILEEDYLIRYANPDNSGDTTVHIQRDSEVANIYFSFEEGIVELAPDPARWSLLFSKYTTMLVTNEGENYPYLVMGALLNPIGVSATLDTIHTFADMELSDTIDLDFTTRADAIGYDWKYYNFDAGLYTIVPNMHYVIRDRDGFYYKLRFVDFYNEEHKKGYPTFEFIRL